MNEGVSRLLNRDAFCVRWDVVTGRRNGTDFVERVLQGG